MHMIQVIQINRTTNKGKKGGEKKEETQWMETGQNTSFLD